MTKELSDTVSKFVINTSGCEDALQVTARECSRRATGHVFHKSSDRTGESRGVGRGTQSCIRGSARTTATSKTAVARVPGAMYSKGKCYGGPNRRQDQSCQFDRAGVQSFVSKERVSHRAVGHQTALHFSQLCSGGRCVGCRTRTTGDDLGQIHLICRGNSDGNRLTSAHRVGAILRVKRAVFNRWNRGGPSAERSNRDGKAFGVAADNAGERFVGNSEFLGQLHIGCKGRGLQRFQICTAANIRDGQRQRHRFTHCNRGWLGSHGNGKRSDRATKRSGAINFRQRKNGDARRSCRDGEWSRLTNSELTVEEQVLHFAKRKRIRHADSNRADVWCPGLWRPCPARQLIIEVGGSVAHFLLRARRGIALSQLDDLLLKLSPFAAL